MEKWQFISWNPKTDGYYFDLSNFFFFELGALKVWVILLVLILLVKGHQTFQKAVSLREAHNKYKTIIWTFETCQNIKTEFK